MKRFTIPLINKYVILYEGPDEWPTFVTTTIRWGVSDNYKDADCPGKNEGRSWGSWIWVYNKHDRATVIHELSHTIDRIMEDLRTDDTEFRAHITEWITEKVLNYTEATDD